MAHAVETNRWTFIQPATPTDIRPITSITDSTGIWGGGDVDGAPVVARYTLDGTFEHFRFFAAPNGFYNTNSDSMVLLPLQDSGVEMVLNGGGDMEAPLCGVARFAADGTQVWSTASFWFCDIVSADPTGAIVLTSSYGTTRLASDGATNDAIFATTPYVAADPVTTFPATQGVAYYGEPLIHATSSPDGSVYLLSSRDYQSYALSRVSPAGQLQWRVEFNNFTDVVGADNDRVCARGYDGTTESVSCYAAADGHVIFSGNLGGEAFLAFRLLDDGELLTLTEPYPAETIHLRLFDTTGSLVSDAVLDAPVNLSLSTIVMGPTGVIGIADNTGAGTVYAFDKHGARVYALALPVLSGTTAQAYTTFSAVAADGSSVISIGIDNPGNFTYRTVIVSPSGALVAALDGVNNVDYVKDDIAFLLSPANTSLSSSRVQKVSLTTGEVISDITLPYDNYYTFAIDATTGLLVASNARVNVIDPGTGAIVHSIRPDCGDVPCSFPISVMLTTDGTVRIAQNFGEPNRGGTFRVDAFTETPTPDSIRVDQRGLNGAWYAQSSSGQGFTIDYVPEAGIFFMAWFTYGIDAINDPQQLAWVTVQGFVQPGATQADLSLVRSMPGVFDSGTTDSRVAGTAHVSFTDCNNGFLDFQFDHEDFLGASGSMVPITRLSPTTSPCILADGTTQPAQNTNPPSNGFDARQSGSWYEPATTGQGIELTVVPSGENYAGLIYGAWFTFDPPPGDNDQHEHWFTLQGDLSAAVDGKVELPIFQIFGSSLLGAPTHNINRVGTATLAFRACDAATLDYRFDNSDVAHEFAGRSGTIDLSKIDGCASN